MAQTQIPPPTAQPASSEVGYILSIRDYLAYLDGLPTVRMNDLVESDAQIRGVVASLMPEKVEVWILDEGQVIPGQIFKKTDKKLNITVGDFLLGRAVNPLGVPIDGKGTLSKIRGELLDLDQAAPSLNKRQFINTQFITGVTLVDSLMPLGKGQRQLILGDIHSGKTPFLTDIIVNQIKQGTICIYASVGKPISSLRSMINTLTDTKAIKNTIVVATSSTESPALIYFTPFAAMTVAEYFQRKGRDVLVIFDDLGTHAKVYRELSLLAGRAPGRESYPGDIFHTHARLLERAGRFNNLNGGGSITALPVMELDLADFTGFIPTNLMAMTDGHLLFRSQLSAQGFRPAVDLSISVTRVGNQTQNRLQNLLSQVVKQILTQGAQLETVTRFSSELPEQTQLILSQKEIIQELLVQEPLTYFPLEIQLIMLGLVLTSFVRGRNRTYIQKNKTKLLDFLQNDAKLKNFAKDIPNLKSLDQLVTRLELIVPTLKQICT